MVKIGDVVVAVGMGEFFTKMSGGMGQGEVVHVENPEGIAINTEVIAMEIPEEFLTEGILYKDFGDGEIKWLAPNDFEIVEE